MRNWSIVVVAALLGMSAPHAHAASSEEDASAGAGLVLLSLTAGIALAGIGSYFITTKSDGDNKSAFLRANETELTYELAVGAGPVVDHLAAMYSVPADRREAFARRLSDEQRSLMTFARAGGHDARSANNFFARVAALAAQVAVAG